jgi:sulfite reductase alpha subunit-like flavoprotein
MMVEGKIENYLIVVDKDYYIEIGYDNREVDTGKLLKILGVVPNMEISIDENTEKQLLDTIKRYDDNKSCLAQVFIDNKKQLESEIIRIISENSNYDITQFLEKLDKQTAYCFDDIEEIKDSANNLPLWLEQVRGLSRRKDL